MICISYAHLNVFLAVDQITSISDTTPLSSLEMEVLAVYISESWESLAPMLDVDESNVETIFDPDMVWSMEYYRYIQAVILLYLYNENDHFSRERLVQSCKKCGISDVKERLKRWSTVINILFYVILTRGHEKCNLMLLLVFCCMYFLLTFFFAMLASPRGNKRFSTLT